MDKWDKKFLGLAIYYSTFSKDPSTKIGCVLVDDFNTPVGLGYNGFSRESDDREDHLNNREEKYPRTIHAEENAIFNRTDSVRDSRAYITHPPCVPCINRLSHNGIKHATFFVSNDAKFNERWCLDRSIDEMKRLGMTYELVSASPEEKYELFVPVMKELMKEGLELDID